MARKRNAADPLSERLLAVLEAQRALGGDAYPLTLQRLAELADPSAPMEQVKEAVGKKPFKDGAVLTSSKTKDPGGLVAVKGDVEQLAGDPRLLKAALEPLCTPDDPLRALTDVKKFVENGKVQKPFVEIVTRQVRENALPEAIGGRLEKKKPLLYLKKFPPRDPAEVLAEKLLHVLDAQRRLGGNSYPLPLKRLVQLTAPKAGSKLVLTALGQPGVKEKVLLLDAKNGDVPIAFLDDRDLLFSNPALLEPLMGKHLKDTNDAVVVDKLLPNKKSPHLGALRDAVDRWAAAGLLPPAIGWLWFGKKKLLFYLKNIHTIQPSDAKVAPPALIPHPPPAEPPADFAAAFDDAFQRLNREKGNHNFVSFVDLRRALPMAADAFNAELRKLRVAGRYTLSGAEGRDGLSPEQRQAGIVEDGSLLLYVSRKNP
ncbi:MAG TPA: hypothetical protein VMS17_33750 [Gemmataceae bacterium]|nr:hypothetical protein [Gemmataceae bacterium]